MNQTLIEIAVEAGIVAIGAVTGVDEAAIVLLAGIGAIAIVWRLAKKA